MKVITHQLFNQLNCLKLYINQWRAVASETGHAIGMPKSVHAIGYFMGSQ